MLILLVLRDSRYAYNIYLTHLGLSWGLSVIYAIGPVLRAVTIEISVFYKLQYVPLLVNDVCCSLASPPLVFGRLAGLGGLRCGVY